MAGSLEPLILARRAWRLSLPRGREWALGPRPAVLGVLNLTPDSFSDGGRYPAVDDAVDAGLRMLAEGADALDLGGESTRPGAEDIPADEQLRRVLPVLRVLRQETAAPLSVDTRDPKVGAAVLESGADIINDVSACRDPDWLPVLRASTCPVVLMHMRGSPRDMQRDTAYPRGVVTEVVELLAARMAQLEAAGIARERFLVDPGIGFAKTAEHNLEILLGLEQLAALGRPVLVGASRKFFLGKVLGQRDGRGRDPSQRDVGTVAANLFALLGGASVLRVHNVAYTRDLVDVFEAIARCAIGERGEGA
jgi:dihydropteroate synthase